MKVSMDGLRKNLSGAYNTYMRLVKMNGTISQFNGDEMDALEEIRQYIGALNCVESDNPDDLMTDLEHIELEKVYPK